VNFLYDDIVHALRNTIDWCINSDTDRRGYVLERNATAITPFKSFKVTEFGTNRKPTFY